MKKMSKNMLKVCIVVITVIAGYILNVMYSNKVDGIGEKIIYAICTIIVGIGTFLAGWIIIEAFASIIEWIISLIEKMFSKHKRRDLSLNKFDENDLSEFERSILEKVRRGEVKIDKLEEYLLQNSMKKLKELLKNKKISNKLMFIIFISLIFYLLVFLSVAIFDVPYVILENISNIYYDFCYFTISVFRYFVFSIFFNIYIQRSNY